MNYSEKQKDAFVETVYRYYEQNLRSFPWRDTSDPFHILVSEFMLQQTQTDRVVPKFLTFITKFPTVRHLASAQSRDVLASWQGLGYNRRALYLHESAKIIVTKHNASVPSAPEILSTLPGIGPYTSSAIAAFAFNKPTIFIETNIRSAFIHHFFNDSDSVTDKEILALVKETLDRKNPREWYWALMDYGYFVKKTFGNPNSKSRHYTRQSPFEGSVRQVRGTIIRTLTKQETLSSPELSEKTGLTPDTLTPILKKLEQEGFLIIDGRSVSLRT